MVCVFYNIRLITLSLKSERTPTFFKKIPCYFEVDLEKNENIVGIGSEPIYDSFTPTCCQQLKEGDSCPPYFLSLLLPVHSVNQFYHMVKTTNALVCLSQHQLCFSSKLYFSLGSPNATDIENTYA